MVTFPLACVDLQPSCIADFLNLIKVRFIHLQAVHFFGESDPLGIYCELTAVVPDISPFGCMHVAVDLLETMVVFGELGGIKLSQLVWNMAVVGCRDSIFGYML